MGMVEDDVEVEGGDVDDDKEDGGDADNRALTACMRLPGALVPLLQNLHLRLWV